MGLLKPEVNEHHWRNKKIFLYTVTKNFSPEHVINNLHYKLRFHFSFKDKIAKKTLHS